jgi:hypothetical protein
MYSPIRGEQIKLTEPYMETVNNNDTLEDKKTQSHKEGSTVKQFFTGLGTGVVFGYGIFAAGAYIECKRHPSSM